MKNASSSQKLVISHFNGPALVIAGPGSGKTFSVINRVNSLISNHKISPDQILVVTFSKHAANEMNNRYKSLSNSFGVLFCTFHSLAYNYLINYSKFDKYKLVSENEKLKIFITVLKNNDLDKNTSKEEIISLINQLSYLKNTNNYKNDYSSYIFQTETIPKDKINYIINQYLDYLKEFNLVDFDDIIINCLKMLSDFKTNGYDYKKYKYIIVDEFQDINQAQYDFIKLISYSKNIMVVGDV